ncbi:MAG: DUF4160 domain-containing protein [Salinivirgaceae bacterium]|nr:DUF4160 domain-containing protein [Salinivirgaceae bacterium]
MPKLYQYMGISLWFWSNEHDPIHVHARCGGATTEVLLYVKDGRVSRVVYKPVAGKFSSDKQRALRDLISVMKENIRVAWIDYFINHRHIEPIVFNSKIK